MAQTGRPGELRPNPCLLHAPAAGFGQSLDSCPPDHREALPPGFCISTRFNGWLFIADRAAGSISCGLLLFEIRWERPICHRRPHSP